MFFYFVVILRIWKSLERINYRVKDWEKDVLFKKTNKLKIKTKREQKYQNKKK